MSTGKVDWEVVPTYHTIRDGKPDTGGGVFSKDFLAALDARPPAPAPIVQIYLPSIQATPPLPPLPKSGGSVCFTGGKVFQGEFADIQGLLWRRIESKTLSVGRLLYEKPAFPLGDQEAVFNETWQAVQLNDRTDPVAIVGDGELYGLRVIFAGLLAIAQQIPVTAPFYIWQCIRVLSDAELETQQRLGALFDKEITIRLAALCEDSLTSVREEKEKQVLLTKDLSREEKEFIVNFVPEQIHKRFSGDIRFYRDDAINIVYGKIIQALREGREIGFLRNYISAAISNLKKDTIKKKDDALAHRAYDNARRRVEFMVGMAPSVCQPDTNDDEKEGAGKKASGRFKELRTAGLSKDEAYLEIQIETRSDRLREGGPVPDERYEGPDSFDEDGDRIYRDSWLQSIEERESRASNHGPTPFLEDIYESHDKEYRPLLSNWIASHWGNMPEEKQMRRAFWRFLEIERWRERVRRFPHPPAFLKKWGAIMQKLLLGWTFDEIEQFWSLPANQAGMNQYDVDRAEKFILQRIRTWAGIGPIGPEDQSARERYGRMEESLRCPVGAKTKPIIQAEWPKGRLRWTRGKRWKPRGPQAKDPEIDDGGGPTVGGDYPEVICDQPQEVFGRYEPNPEDPPPSRVRPPQNKTSYWTFKWSPRQAWSLRWSARRKAFVEFSRDPVQLVDVRIRGGVLCPDLQYPKETSVAAYLKRGGAVEISSFAPISAPSVDTKVYQRHLDLLEDVRRRRELLRDMRRCLELLKNIREKN